MDRYIFALWQSMGTMCVVLALACGTRAVGAQATGGKQRGGEGARIEVASSPSLRITGSEKVPFNAIVGATRLHDDSFLIADRSDFALQLFDKNGRAVKQFARKGKGPGEVEFLLAMYRCGNALLAIDLSGNSVNEFREDGSFVREYRYTEPPYRAACNSAGKFVQMAWGKSGGVKEKLYREIAGYSVSDAYGTKGTSLGTMPGSERFDASPRPLGREPRVAIGPDRAYVALADSMFIRVFDLTGKELPPLRAPYTAVKATDDDFAAALERDVASMGEKTRPMFKQIHDAAPRTRFLPATLEMVVDAMGLVWVQHFPAASSTTVQWSIFAPGGQLRATVQLPVAFDVYEVGKDYVLGRYIDQDSGVPEVRMYSVRRGGS